MQERHKNRRLYFNELAQTSRKYFIPYIKQFKHLGEDCRVLEIGCGDGGNLLPFAQMGCCTLGVDIAEGRIADARKFFTDCSVSGDFIASDVFLLEELYGTFDIIICHDVIEHIGEKQRFLSLLPPFLTRDGIVFMSFPAWHMPFGGHQQICRSKAASHLPFVHLLPNALYRLLLKACGEDDGCIREMMSIKETRISIEMFEHLLKSIGKLTITDRTLWLINPHYETKFGFRPLQVPPCLANIPYVRNFYTTSCFYVLSRKEQA